MVTVTPVSSANWHDVAQVRASEEQRRWVEDVSHYLCLAAYEGVWRSCAVEDEHGSTVGHVMWAVDPEELSHCIGGLVIDAGQQRRGLGRATVEALLAWWERDEPALSGTPFREAALTVAPDNTAARALYRGLGFVETGEMSEGEVVLRRPR